MTFGIEKVKKKSVKNINDRLYETIYIAVIWFNKSEKKYNLDIFK